MKYEPRWRMISTIVLFSSVCMMSIVGEVACGNAGSTGGGVQTCVTLAECPQPADARCGKATCQDGVCGLALLARPGEVVPIASQLRGDCQTIMCDATGHSVTLEDASDTYDDGKICTNDVCKGGTALNIDIEDALPCPGGEAGYCYQGECVECIAFIPGPNQDCGTGNQCTVTQCITASCIGKCGNGCALCADGSTCDKGSDCKSHVCGSNFKCVPPDCSDSVKNGDETGVDCGMAACETTCPDNQGCEKSADCQSGVCWVGLCQPPTCTDGVKNGKEINVDCGGPCAACPP